MKCPRVSPALATVCSLAVLAILASPAQGRLLRPEVEPVFAEAFAGFVFPVTKLDNTLARTLGADTTWSPRFGFGLVGGARVWAPLNLDVGLRFGLSFQRGYTANQSKQSFDTSVKMIELVPVARGALFPFGSEHWGLQMELGFGMLLGTGGAHGSKDFPPETQMMLRVRMGVGVVWMWSKRMGLSLEALGLCTDIPVTDFFQDEVGTMLSLESNLAFRYRF